MEALDATRAAELLPPGARRAALVLFCDPSSERGSKAVLRFESIDVGRHLRRALIDIRQTPDVADYFGIDEGPALAIIQQGALLAIEEGCTDADCTRVQAWARSQTARLRHA